MDELRRPSFLSIGEGSKVCRRLDEAAKLSGGVFDGSTVTRTREATGDPALWPDELTREMFHTWFDCELSTIIWDMLKARIKPAF